MDYTDIIYSKDLGVATITLNRPDHYNALRLKTLMELNLALEDAVDDGTLGVIVITGAGEKAFCTGGDVGELGNLDKTKIQKTNRLLIRTASLLRNAPKPIIAAVNGLCIGGGNELNLFCDLTIASDRARFGHAEPKIGAAPLWGGTQLLPRIIGEKRAREMVLMCRMYSAKEARELGLVNKVVTHEKLFEEVRFWCDELLALSPQSLRMCKLSLNFETDLLWPSFNHGLAMVELGWESKELKEGLVSFKEKRKPRFRNFE